MAADVQARGDKVLRRCQPQPSKRWRQLTAGRCGGPPPLTDGKSEGVGRDGGAHDPRAGA